MTTRTRSALVRATDATHRVTTLELLFDLVFVFAFTQVTQLMGDDPTARGALRGLVLLALLWWAWCSYAWLGNQAHADEGVVRATVVTAMGAMLVVALVIPESFHDRRAGFMRRWCSLPGAPHQTALWALALLVDYTGIWLAGTSGWRVPSPAHFAERYGLIFIVAVGESLVALGVGVNGQPVSLAVLVAAALGMVVAVSLWWLYFDVVASVAEGVLSKAQGEERSRLARDSYTYLHFPIVISVIYIALGLKKVLEYVSDTAGHHLSEALTRAPLVALYAGVAVHLLGHVAFRRATSGPGTRIAASSRASCFSWCRWPGNSRRLSLWPWSRCCLPA